MPPRRDELLDALRRLVHHARQVDQLLAESHLPAADARDVEEVVHEPRHVPHLATRRRERALADTWVRAIVLEEAHGVRHRREGVPQLVREHREELVLAAVGLAQLLVAPWSSAMSRSRSSAIAIA
jgi:hypothetical protein